MSFQAYINNIKEKTGKTPEDFKQLAEAKGFLQEGQLKTGVKAGDIISWLKADFDLGHGHANAIVHVIQSHGQEEVSTEDAVAAHFAGKKGSWRAPYDEMMAKVGNFGGDVTAGPGKTYISLLRGAKKFGIVQVTAERIDLGIKLKGVTPTARLEAGGSWNAMVTHRVRIGDAKEIDAEVFGWLEQAYAAAK